MMNIPICCNDWMAVDDGIICALSNANSICYINTNTNDVNYLYSSTDDFRTEYLYSYNFEVENKIIWIPYNAKNILVYEVEKNEFHEIELEKKLKNTRFWSGFVYGNNIYMFGENRSLFLILNVETEQYLVEYIKELMNYGNEGFSNGVVIVDEYAYVGTHVGLLAKISLKNTNKNVEFIKIPHKVNVISSISLYKNMMYIMGFYENTAKLIMWDIRIDNSDEIELFDCSNKEKDRYFHPPIYYNGKIYVFSLFDIKRHYVVNINKKEAYENEKFINLFFNNNNSSCGLYFLKQEGESIIFQTRADYVWRRFNLASNTVEWQQEYFLNDKQFWQNWKKDELLREMENNSFIIEKYGYLEAYINTIVR